MTGVFDRETEEKIAQADRIVFFTGEHLGGSGNPLFDRKQNYRILNVQTMKEDPETFYAYIREHLENDVSVPSPVHRYIAGLQRSKDVSVITESIDGLFVSAGIISLVELYGSVRRAYCRQCLKEYPIGPLLYSKELPICSECGGEIRPDIVLSGEQADGNRLYEAGVLIRDADLVVVCGTVLDLSISAYLISLADTEKTVFCRT